MTPQALERAEAMIRGILGNHRHPAVDRRHRNHAAAERALNLLVAAVARHRAEQRQPVLEEFARERAEHAAAPPQTGKRQGRRSKGAA